MYSKANSTDPLSCATAATALGYLSLNEQYVHLKPLALKKHTEAVRLVGSALSGGQSANQDDLLMSVLMLGMHEVSVSEQCEAKDSD